MKHFIIGLIILLLCSCVNKAKRTQENVDGTGFDVVVIDSCEYLIANAGYKGYMAHKGNCKYCEQRKHQKP